MALLFMEGWDAYSDQDELIEHPYILYTTVSSLYTEISTLTPYSHGRSLKLRDSSRPVGCSFLSNSSGDTVYGGFGYRKQRFSANNEDNFTLLGTDNSLKIGITTKIGGFISVYRGSGTEIAASSSPDTMPFLIWNYIQFRFKLHDSTGTVEVWLNGQKVIDDTGLDTLEGASATLGGVRFNADSTINDYSWYDDIYIGDTSGSDMTNLATGQCRVETVWPNANGATNDFISYTSGVSNYANVDDGSVSDGDTTYNYSSTVTDKDLYQTAALAGNVGNIYAVQSQARMRKVDAGDRTVNSIIRSNTSESDGAVRGCSSDYTRVYHTSENDPNGGVNWTETTANNAQIGLEINS